MLRSLATLLHFAISFFVSVLNASGVIPTTGSAPSAARRAFTSSATRICWISRFNLLTISAGVLARV
jgi:hypothetical protein